MKSKCCCCSDAGLQHLFSIFADFPQVFWTLLPHNTTVFSVVGVPGSGQILSGPHWCRSRQTAHPGWTGNMVVRRCDFTNHWTF